MIIKQAIVGITMTTFITISAWASDYEGCTPGYWKQQIHFGQWSGVSPTDSFTAVFGVNGGEITLLEALKAKGGGTNALGRHAAAAYLNSTSPIISYMLTADEVIAIVQLGYTTGDFESAKNLLEQANDEGCPL
jgi:hypothetical protein